MRIDFTKMHGLGNDFIVFDAPRASFPTTEQIRRLADRHTGIGFDQALVLSEPERRDAQVRYRIFNCDGSEVEQCGNGARCIASLVARRLGRRDHVYMDSTGGRVNATLQDNGDVAIGMGVPNFAPASLPFTAAEEANTYTLQVGERSIEIGAVSMGNPHAVWRVPSVAAAP